MALAERSLVLAGNGQDDECIRRAITHKKGPSPSSNSAWRRTLDFDITIANMAVERSFPCWRYSPDNIHEAIVY